MMIASRTKSLLGVCAVGCGVAALAACSSPASSSASGGTQPTSSSNPATSAAATPASLSQLKTIVLQPADLPSGWKGAAYQQDPNDNANNAALLQCVGARNTESDKVAEAHSDDFGLSNATVSSQAASYRSQSDLDADIATLHNPKLSSCYDQLVKKQLAGSMPAGSSIVSESVTITPGSAGGPANVVATGTGTIVIKANGQQVPVYLTVAFITGPLIEAQVSTDNVGTPLPASVVNPLVATVASRADAQ